MTPWNPFSVSRPATSAGFRTHIDDPITTFRVFNPENQIAQLKLYHWSRSMDWINSVGCGNLFDYLFYNTPYITKRQMGRVLAQASPYKVPKLKGRTKENDKAQMQYVWNARLDLQYGLEWMLSLWIWRVDNNWKDIINHDLPKLTEEIFDDIASLSEAELLDLYIVPVLNEQFVGDAPSKEPDWQSLWAKHEMGVERVRAQVGVRPDLLSIPKEKPGRPKFSST